MKRKYGLLFLLIITPFLNISSQDFSKDLYYKNYINPYSQQGEITPLNYIRDFNYPQIQSLQNEYVIIDSILSFSSYDSKSKYTYTYDDDGRIISFNIFYFLNDIWENGWQITNSFDSLGNLLFTLHESWSGNYWGNVTREVYTNNSDGNSILHLIQLWVNNNWKDDFRITNSYDSEGNRIESLTEEWNDSLWINTYRTTTDYYPNGLWDASLFEIWNDNKWEYDMFIIAYYNDEWKIEEAIGTKWDENRWKFFVRILNTYNIDDPHITELYQLWDEKNNIWLDYDRNLYTLNGDKYMSLGLYEYWEDDSWLPGEGIIHINNPDGFSAHFLAKEVKVYYDPTTEIKNENKFNPHEYELTQNYPNPFNPSTTISYQLSESGHVTIIVYDTIGKEVAELVNENKIEGRYTVQFNGVNFSSGIYFYSIKVNLPALPTGQAGGKAGGYSATKKMVLLR